MMIVTACVSRTREQPAYPLPPFSAFSSSSSSPFPSSSRSTFVLPFSLAVLHAPSSPKRQDERIRADLVEVAVVNKSARDAVVDII